ncbi:MAG: pyridoxal phosphate-dependent aminotransferase [Clostridiales bacterium]|nr:pyridoxal phosphate-dependent aminotransferase [Clostridiales bacterium]
MVNDKMYELGSHRSVIREIFEYAKKRAGEIGAENIFDFSIGNPSVPAPDCVNEALIDLIKNTDSVKLHGYSSAQGDASVRKTIADYINKRFGTTVSGDNIYMTTGAAAALSIVLKSVATENSEYITFAPYFTEYKVFVEAMGSKLVVLPSEEKTFDMDFDALENAINENTKAVIINSPNNPSGVVYPEKSIKRLSEILKKYSEKYGHIIYLIADEPYRELVYDGIDVPYPICYYDNTFVCYSYSKSLSLPGERIGYICVSDRMENWQTHYAAVCGAGRALGYVCATTLFQYLAAKCVDKTSDVSVYKRNRDLLYNSLTDYGYECVHPDGAFYLFMKALEDDAYAFCERAKKYELLLVPGDDFGCPGYVRIAYCVKPETIERALPSFKKLIEEYGK